MRSDLPPLAAQAPSWLAWAAPSRAEAGACERSFAVPSRAVPPENCFRTGLGPWSEGARKALSRAARWVGDTATTRDARRALAQSLRTGLGPWPKQKRLARARPARAGRQASGRVWARGARARRRARAWSHSSGSGEPCGANKTLCSRTPRALGETLPDWAKPVVHKHTLCSRVPRALRHTLPDWARPVAQTVCARAPRALGDTLLAQTKTLCARAAHVVQSTRRALARRARAVEDNFRTGLGPWPAKPRQNGSRVLRRAAKSARPVAATR